jgi:hypothetical protein
MATDGRTMGKVKAKPLSIFLGIHEIAGYYVNLEAGLRENGVNARLVTTRPHPFEYGQGQANPWPAEFASNGVRGFRSANPIAKMWFGAQFLVGSFLTLLWAIPRYNTFVFGWGMSFLPGNIDVLFLRLCGKNVVSVLGHGSEARPPYMSTPPEPLPLSSAHLACIAKETSHIARRVRRLERWSTHTIGMLATAQFLTKRFIDFYYIGLPTPSREIPTQDVSSEQFTILHVPSNMAVKGTLHIRDAVEQVIKRHPHVKYVELSGVSHDEVMTAMSKASVVVDWLWSDIPMAVVGTEAASMGTATVISGYAWPQWDAWEKKNPGRRPPALYATPDTIQDVIERAVVEHNKTKNTGLDARQFITKNWAPSCVAATFVQALEHLLPKEGYLEPKDVTYLWGAGVAQQDVQKNVSDLIRAHGPDALQWDRGVALYGLGES